MMPLPYAAKRSLSYPIPEHHHTRACSDQCDVSMVSWVCSGSGMAPPEWRQKLEDALKKNKDKSPFAQYYTVATVRTDSRPANRTVVHRGFYGNDCLEWITDKR